MSHSKEKGEYSLILGRDVTDLIFAILNHYGRMSCSKTLRTLKVMCNEAAKYIPEESELHEFLLSYPTIFKVNDGYVSLNEIESALDVEMDSSDGELAALLQVYFQDFSDMHRQTYYKLIKDGFKDFCASVKTFISNLSESQMSRFFRENPAFYVSREDDVEAIFMRRSGHEHMPGTVESDMRCTFNETLKKIGRCHYKELMDIFLAQRNCGQKISNSEIIIDFIDNLSELEKYWYFRHRCDIYFISCDGKVQFLEIVRKQVVEFLHSELQKVGITNHTDLISIFKHAAPVHSEYFIPLPCSEKVRLFRDRPHLFIVHRDLRIEAVKLSKNEQKQKMNEKQQKRKKRKYGEAFNVSLKEHQTLHFLPKSGNVQTETQAINFLLSELGSQNMNLQRLLRYSMTKSLDVLCLFEGCTSAVERQFFLQKSDCFCLDGRNNVSAALRISQQLGEAQPATSSTCSKTISATTCSKTISATTSSSLPAVNDSGSSSGSSVSARQTTNSYDRRTKDKELCCHCIEEKKKHFFAVVLPNRLEQMWKKLEKTPKRKNLYQLFEIANDGEYFKFFLKGFDVSKDFAAILHKFGYSFT